MNIRNRVWEVLHPRQAAARKAEDEAGDRAAREAEAAELRSGFVQVSPGVYVQRRPGEPVRIVKSDEVAPGIYAVRTAEPEGMARFPYTWSGIDASGQERWGCTQMRDQTVPAMVRGFRDAGYQRLRVYREGGPKDGADSYAGTMGGIETGRDGKPTAWAMASQKQREPQ